MAMSTEATFQIEEYKALKEEIAAKTKDVRDLNRWGLLGLAAVYSYIFSHLDKRWLFWVPVGLSIIVIGLLWTEYRLVERIGRYIRDCIEAKVAPKQKFDGVKASIRGGWERYLAPTEGKRTPLWYWGPTPIWLTIFAVTLVVALLAFFCGAFPNLVRSR
jgi:hypothetical protein